MGSLGRALSFGLIGAAIASLVSPTYSDIERVAPVKKLRREKARSRQKQSRGNMAYKAYWARGRGPGAPKTFGYLRRLERLARQSRAAGETP